MTPEMVQRAQGNAQQGGYGNVEFRLGTIENLPVQDESVDLIISNCVINLSPEKRRVFEEAYRVLKPGGRLVVSDLVAERTPTQEERLDMDLYSACVSGAETSDVVYGLLKGAGFEEPLVESATEPFNWGDPDAPVVAVYSATISASKPAHRGPDPTG
jgi:SAM-dependent methyltransferase